MWVWLSVKDQSPPIDCVPNTGPQPNLQASVLSMLVGASLVKMSRAPTILFIHQIHTTVSLFAFLLC